MMKIGVKTLHLTFGRKYEHEQEIIEHYSGFRNNF